MLECKALSPKTYEWISPARDAKLKFKLDNGTVTAALFLKRSPDNEFHHKYNLKEKDITIERYNLNELMRGISQVTFRMDQLKTNQKAALLESLSSRNIEIINDTSNSGHINILAL